MSVEFPQPSSPESSQEILSFEDREILNYTLHKFQSYLESIEKDKLPAVVLLPETSTRPLLYAIKPIIEKIYTEKGLDIPDYRFMLTIRNPEREEFGVSDSADQNKISALRREIESLKEWPEGGTYEEKVRIRAKNEKKLPAERRKFQKESGWREAREKRFKEILETSKKGNILILDDFINEYESLDQIYEFENLMSPGTVMESYILVDLRKDNERDRPKRKYDNKIHTAIHYLNHHRLGDTSLWAFSAFSYASRPKQPWESATGKPITGIEAKQALIGVKLPPKPAMQVDRVEPASPDLMAKLRKEMAEIGKKIAEDPSFDEEKWKKDLPIDYGDWGA